MKGCDLVRIATFMTFHILGILSYSMYFLLATDYYTELRDVLVYSFDMLFQSIVILTLLALMGSTAVAKMGRAWLPHLLIGGLVLGVLNSVLHSHVYLNIPILTFWIGFHDLPSWMKAGSTIARLILTVAIWHAFFKLFYPERSLQSTMQSTRQSTRRPTDGHPEQKRRRSGEIRKGGMND